MNDVQPRAATIRRTLIGFAAVLLAAALPTRAAELHVLADLDVNATTGCTVTTPGGPFTGVEQRFITTVNTTVSPPVVTGVTREICTNAATNTFGAPVSVSPGGWNVGVGNGIGGNNVIETGLPIPAGTSQVRVGLIYIDPAIGSDALITTPGGAAIIVALAAVDPTQVPTLSEAMLALLLVLIGGVAFVHLRRKGYPAAPLAVVVLVMAATMAWAATIVLDGLTNDWTGIPPVATDPTGDAPVGADISAAFGVIQGGTLYMRVDVKTGLPPLPVNDSYTATAGTPLTIGTGAGLRANDTLGVPAANVTFFGGGSLGGVVTDHAAGSAATFGAGGSLTVNGDGSFTFTPATGFTGNFTFNYRLTNINASSDGLVTINVQQAPAITSANTATFTVGSAGSFTVTATGAPAPTFAIAGALPAGVFFSTTTGVFAGTPGVGTAGSYAVTITASNGVLPNATQAFTLVVNQGTTITSANNATFTVGTAGTFTVTTTASPTATTITQTGALPAGVTFVNNGNGTATLAGIPGAGTGGTYPITINATNGVGPAGVQSFTLTVNQAPAITSVNNATFVIGVASNFTVTTSGFPAAAITRTGALPAGITLTDNGNGTATLGGTATASGTFPITLQAANGVLPNATQAFTITVNAPAAFTSANATTFTVGSAGTFTVTTSGVPAVATIGEVGALPAGVTFVSNGDGTATLAGTPGAGTGGTYSLTFNATNGVGPVALQSFTLTVRQAPAITSANSATFVTGVAGTFIVTTSGFPAPAVAETGALPAGVSFTDNGNGTATIAGTPSAGGAFPITLTASNGVTPNGTQAFTIQVNTPAAITSANAVTFTVGTPGTFTVTTSGIPIAGTITETGALPGGVSFTNNGNGTATLAGVPNVASGGTYTLTIGATNGVGVPASQSFTLTVNEAPQFTSANNVTFSVGATGTFVVTTLGFPFPAINETGALPGGVGFTDNGNGTATLTGVPSTGQGGVHTLALGASNGIGAPAAQTFTLNVNEPPVANGDNYSTVHDTPLTVPAPGVLANDTGSPPPAMQSVTGLGPVTCGAFPCTVPTQHGSVTVQLNGGFTYTPAANTAGPDFFDYTIVNSSGAAGSLANITVTNALPVVDPNGPAPGAFGPVTWTEGAGPVAIVDPAQLTVTDADSTLLASAAVELSPLPDTGSEFIGFTCPDAPPGCSGAIQLADVLYDPVAGFLAIARVAPLADYQALLRTVTYNNTSLNPTGPSRLLGITVNDRIADSISADVTVLISAQNNAPTITAPASVLTAANSAFVFPGTVSVADVDAGTGAVRVTLTATNGTASLSGTAGLAVTGNGTALVDATGPLASQNTALNGMSFTPATNFTGIATLRIDIDDQGNTGAPGPLTANRTINITVDARPTVTTTIPVNGAANYSTTNTVTVNFSEPVNATTSSFAIECPVGSARPYSLSTSPSASFVLTPLSALPAATACRVTVVAAQVTDSVAQAMAANFVFNFTTNTLPTVTSTTPTNGATAIATNSTVTFNFSESVNAAPASFTLECPSGSARAFSLSASPSASFTLTPTLALPNGTACVATALAAGITDADAGQNMAANFPATFTTTTPPAITSGNAATFTVGAAGTFTVTTTGSPTGASMAISETGALPAGVTFVNNNDGTATLAGTPGAGTGGTYPITITANNGVTPNATQSFTLTVNQPPAITSANTATFTVGAAGTFSVTTTGFPTNASMTISETGALPSGVTFVNNGNGTATLAGTPGAGTGGSYPITINASNGVAPAASQSFTLLVNQAPAITSAASTTFVVGSAGTFTVTTSGFPTNASMVISETGALPAGVTFVNNGNGTATLAGTPSAGGTVLITINASNGVAPAASQSFTLTVNQPPAITSANSVTFQKNVAGTTFTVTTTGVPSGASMVISETGALPTGVTFVNNGNGTATIAGTPTVGGAFPITITANNGVTPNATQSFTINVNEAPAITSANSTTFTVGAAGTFTVTTTGFPTNASMAISQTGALPAGVTFTNNNNGTATLAGTPGAGGSFPITITASNGIAPDATQSFTLTVNQAPAITSANSVTFQKNVAGTTFTVTTTGIPSGASMVISETGALPTGVTFVNNGNGTATIAGTPTVGGVFPITITANNGVTPNATQSFTINVNEAPTITSANATTFIPGNAGTFTITTTGTPTVTSITETGALPTGLTFNYTSGANATISGTTSAVGTYPLTIGASNGITPNASQSFTLNVSCPVIAVLPTTLPNGFAGTAYGPVTFSATGGSGSYTFTIAAGTAPPGLGFTGASFGGTPTDVGLYTFTVAATDTATGCTGSVTFTNVLIDLVANNDNIGTVVGNVLVNSAIVPFSVTTNDQFPSGATITAFDATSVHNGTVTMVTSGVNMGQFTYVPPRGYEGPDSFTYTLSKNGRNSTATVSTTVSGMIWFVDNSAGSCTAVPATLCDGRQGFPYTTLNAFSGANTGAAPSPQPNHSIYLATGSAAYTVAGQLVLRTGQLLIGQGATSSFGTVSGLTAGLGQAFPPTGGTFPNANASIGYTTNNRLQGFDMDGATAALTTSSATGFTVNLGRFRRTVAGAGTIVAIGGSGNTGTLTFKSVSVVGSAGITNRGVSVQNLTGSFTVLGNDTGGVTGGTISGHGGNGMEFIGVGTCGSVGSCSGSSVSLTNMTLNANAQSQSVAGNNANCGGAITTGTNNNCVANLYLQNVDGVSISGTSVTNSGQMGINGNNVYDFALSGGSVTGNGNEASENGILFQNLHGTSSINNATILNNAASQVVVGMTNAGLAALNLTVVNVDFRNGSPAANRADAFVLTGAAVGTHTLNISGTQFANNINTNPVPSYFNALAITAGTAAAPLNLNGQVDTSMFASSLNGVFVTAQSSSNVAFHTVNNSQFSLMSSAAIRYETDQPATGTLQGRVTGNSIGAAGFSACAAGATCGGIAVFHFDDGTNANASNVQVTISGNNLQRITNGYAIDVSGEGAGSAHTRIANNTIGPATGDNTNQQEAIDVNYATRSGSTITVCSDVNGNAISNGAVIWGAGFFGSDMHLRARNSTSPTAVRLPGYAGGATNTAAVQTFISGANGGASVFAEATGFGTYTGGAACTTP